MIDWLELDLHQTLNCAAGNYFGERARDRGADGGGGGRERQRESETEKRGETDRGKGREGEPLGDGFACWRAGLM